MHKNYGSGLALCTGSYVRIPRLAKQFFGYVAYINSKRRLQGNLNDPHRSTQTSDLAVPGPIRDERVNILETDAGGRAEIRRVGEVEKFAAELQPDVFAYLKLLVSGEVEIPLAGCIENRLAGVAIV